ncbi:hypothetical protein [Halorubellus litoreus]|uniref:Uncharacterized protein n=1 Tax=Halorubellus litoreus TaxID=755308 RepID=A0ABD5VGY8_9EURY
MEEETETPILFTLNSSEDFRRTAKPAIVSTEGVYHLWIPPEKIDTIMEDILSVDGSRLTKFIAEKLSSERRFQKERRPEFERRQEYKGEDAAQTLDEARMEYGVTPKKLQFEIPSLADFGFGEEGEFVMKGGDASYFFNDIVKEFALKRVKRMNEQIQSTKLDLVKEDELERIDKQSLEIQLSNALEYEDREDFISELEDGQFYPYEINTERGSLLLTGRLIDEQNGGMLSLTTDGKKLTILPKHNSRFDSILRFYRFLVENVDPSASVQELAN